MWLDRFKIALSQKDVDSINTLLDEVPEFSTKKDMQEAIYLMKESTEMLYALQDELNLSMKQIRQNMKFLATSLDAPSSSFNIRL